MKTTFIYRLVYRLILWASAVDFLTTTPGAAFSWNRTDNAAYTKTHVVDKTYKSYYDGGEKGVTDMFALSASDVRKDWSRVIDSVIHVRPAFIKRTRDNMVLCSNDTVRQLVRTTPIAANSFIEDDGSVTLSMVDVDLVVNADTIEAAKSELINDLIEYAEESFAFESRLEDDTPVT